MTASRTGAIGRDTADSMLWGRKMTEVTVEDIDAIIELVDGLKENAEDEFEEVPASIAEMIGATLGYLRCLRTRVRKAEENGGSLFKETRVRG